MGLREIPLRSILPCLLLAFGATAAGAQSIDLTVHPATGPQAAPLDLNVRPVAAPQAAAVDVALPPATTLPSPPLDVLQSASEEVKRVARWVVQTNNNASLPYLVIDKVNAHAYAFSPAGQVKGHAPVLLGMSRGDRLLAPNSATMAQMSEQSRITPAGRFVSRLALDSHGKELLVLDYDASISLHPVVTNKPEERRLERLQTDTAQDNRISFGCINVPIPFYSTVVSPTFTGTKGIVYVLPETSPASALFGFQNVGAVVSGGQASPPAQGAPAVQATVPVSVAN